ncbi:MAG: HAMP domain-containing protein [Desulfarculus sp.]|nr:HAMP domain-containing protein [Desulfarculus sp.]
MFSRSSSRPALGTVWRLTLWYAAALGLCLALFSGLAYYLLAQALLASDRQVILDKASEYLLSGQRGRLEAFLTEIRLQRAVEERAGFFVRVVGPNGDTPVLIVPQEAAGLDLERRLSPPAPPDTWQVLSDRRGRPALELATQALPGGYLLQVGRSPAARLKVLRHFRTALLIAALPALLLALAGGWLLAARSLAPLRHLVATVRGIDAGDLSARVPLGQGEGELEELARRFNLMLEKIARLVGGMAQALDNVAHDLRTPLARLRMTVETALQGPESPTALKEALADCAEESERVVRMLNQLLDLSEASTGILRLDRAPTDLGALVADVAELYAYVAEEKGQTLELGGVTPVTAAVDPGRLRQVVANLLDNALKYTPAGGRVALALEPAGDGVRLCVDDSGPGITPEERGRVFERLYRGDKSRGQRGMGLGLSLVKAVVEAHGGRVEAQDSPLGGARLTVWLPV